MKLIKKIAAIMFAFIMVFTLSSNVNAEETTGTGKITISPANPSQTYKVYRILKLESYDKNKKLYSYVKTGDSWDGFINEQIKDGGYLKINPDGYVAFKEDNPSQETMRAFTKKALDYATLKSIPATKEGKTGANDKNVIIDGLDLGYYLVGSTTGALCSLTTTNPEEKINDKNIVPTVNKQVLVKTNPDTYGPKNSVSIGDHVQFKTTINVKPGAKNYILHDKMDSNLKFVDIRDVSTNNNVNLLRQENGQDFTVSSTNLPDKCTFEISFTEKFYNTYREQIDNGELSKIEFTYIAIVNDSAPVNKEMKNNTYLTFGENNTKSNEDYTITKTFGIPVFKYTGTNTPLPGAKFILSTDPNCKDSTKTLRFKLNSDDKYRYDETSVTTKLESLNDGMINIEGIKAGTYYLKETEAPKGYNLLKTIQTIEISEDGSIKLNGKPITNNVGVQNNTGSLLPSTGGMGTTLIYLIGGALVLGSGIVLANKKRAKAK